MNNRQEELLAKLVAFGGGFTSIFIIASLTMDPVNLPKMFALIVISFTTIGIWGFQKYPDSIQKNKSLIGVLGAFSVGLLASTLFARIPLETSIFGTSGRNTGALSYVSLTILLYSVSLIRNVGNLRKILAGLAVAGFINVIYGLQVTALGKDFFPWRNPYGTIIGTFGNPDFLSAFLGMSFSVTFAYLIFSKKKNYIYGVILVSPLYVFLILKTKALQGLIVLALGLVIIGFFFVRIRFSKKLQFTYIITMMFLGSMSILGMLQVGPLTSFLYKTSVSLRGEYWRAAFNMIRSSPIYGLGMDSYGNFYRRFRNISALTSPGVDVTTDSAHNVFLDIFVGGGLILGISYLILNFMVIHRIITIIKSRNNHDPIFISLTTGWICYTAQSVISINQLGLAIWGWILSGAIFSYSKILVNESRIINRDYGINVKAKKYRKVELEAGNWLLMIIFSILGFVIAILPVRPEAAWRHAGKIGDAKKLIQAMNSWPQSTDRYLQTSKVLAGSNLGAEALNSLKVGIQHDRDFYNGWLILYSSTKDNKEKLTSLNELHRLDPLNPEFKP